MALTEQSEFLLEVLRQYGIVGLLICSFIFLLLNSKIKFEYKKLYHHFKFEFGGIHRKYRNNVATQTPYTARINADHSIRELIYTALFDCFFNGRNSGLKPLIIIGIVFLLIF